VKPTAEIHEIQLEPANAGVVECIGEALGLAATGQVSTIAIIIIQRDGCPRFSHSAIHNYSMMVGAIARLQHDIIIEGE
jgi:hypothetical protein